MKQLIYTHIYLIYEWIGYLVSFPHLLPPSVFLSELSFQDYNLNTKKNKYWVNINEALPFQSQKQENFVLQGQKAGPSQVMFLAHCYDMVCKKPVMKMVPICFINLFYISYLCLLSFSLVNQASLFHNNNIFWLDGHVNILLLLAEEHDLLQVSQLLPASAAVHAGCFRLMW